MAPNTPGFGLSWFDDTTEGSLSDDDGKFSGEDRINLDNILALTIDHVHNIRDLVVADPAPTPANVELLVNGYLRAGIDYEYRIGYVDELGREFRASDGEVVSTLDPLETPPAPSLTPHVIGSLDSISYEYALSEVRGNEQTELSPVSLIALPPGYRSVSITLPDLTITSTSWRIWRRIEGFSDFDLIYDGPAATVMDNGIAPISEDPEPLEHEFIDNYSFEVTRGDISPEYTHWRLYRTDSPGNYESPSLVATLPAASGSYLDTGETLLSGTPRERNPGISFGPIRIDFETSLPPASARPDGYPFILGSQLYIFKDGSPTLVSLRDPVGGGRVINNPFFGDWDSGYSYPSGAIVRYGYALYLSPYPMVGIDPVSGGWTLICPLIPEGGTTGQVLAKSDDSPSGLEWVTP